MALASLASLQQTAYNVGLVFAPNLVEEHSQRHASDFLVTLWIALALLFIRVASEGLLTPNIKRLLGSIKPGQEKAAADVFDDAWIAVCSGALEVLAIYTTIWDNGNCTPWSTNSCLLGWPHHPANLFQRWYFLAMFGYYLYELFGTMLGVGTILKKDMVIHHFATMALISCSYQTNLLRYGTMWMCLFDLSNPLLHTAKMLNSLEGIPAVERPKWAVFGTFALTFFLARIAAAPYSIIRPAAMHAFSVLPLHWAVIFVSLMAFICGLQWVWFYKIIQLATKGSSKKKD